MSQHKQTKKLYSLKDMLFNEVKVKQLAFEIKSVYPGFDSLRFVRTLLASFPEQELMERLTAIRDTLHDFLPVDYKEAVAIIIKALPLELDEEKVDADFGDFIHAPYSYFVAKYGCDVKHLKLSLNSLREITKRFSAEGALRDFLNNFPEETIAAATTWAKDKNYHVRRLASEGTRPNLPWAKKITINPKIVLPILDILHADKTRYVTRSVANHLNDLAKKDPSTVLTRLKTWQKEKKQTSAELNFITKHALRTLVKKGNQDALKFLGFEVLDVKIKNFDLSKDQIKVGEDITFSFTLSSKETLTKSVMIDYLVHFKKANGQLAAKVFKFSQTKMLAGQELSFTKSHAFKLMSTRTLYSGEHQVEIQVNGQSLGKQSFILG